MGKTRAEIQRAYRERKKLKEGDEYRKNESIRVMKYYIPSQELNRVERTKRNVKAAERNRRHRQKVKREREDQTINDNSISASEVDESFNSSTPIIVKMPFQQRSQSKRKILAQRKRREQLMNAEKEVKKLQLKYRAKEKMLNRLKMRIKEQSQTSDEQLSSTPRKQTHLQIDSLQLTPSRASKVRRHLLVANAILHELSETRKKGAHKKSKTSRMAGKILKKYKCLSFVSQHTGLHRKLLERHAKDKRDTRITSVKRLQSKVEEFLGREDNSRTQPGKKDVKKDENGVKKQTKILTDYMPNLHRKFLAENPDCKISLASFNRLRPRNILNARFLGREACLCIHHQNMSLKMQTLRNAGIKVNSNPEDVLDEDIVQMLAGVPEDQPMNYRVWRRVEDEKKVKRMRIVEVSATKSTFVPLLVAEMESFRGHVSRLREQYKQIRTLKDKLPSHEVILQMDFSENYMCRSMEEIQSAYWHQTAVTLHPIVAYFRDNDDKLCHKSFVVVSDEMSHSTSTVWAVIDMIMPELRTIDPALSRVHFFTDSPTSQYRNKHIFYVVSHFPILYGAEARWNYFEAGHGKGPCDGLGGTTKRMADEACKTGNATIQDAKDFFGWASESTMHEVKFLWLDSSVCKEKLAFVSGLQVQPIKGTMKVHAVAATEASHVMVRDTSCYCQTCLEFGICESWKRCPVNIMSSGPHASTQTPVPPEQTPQTTNSSIQERTVSQVGIEPHDEQCLSDDIGCDSFDKELYSKGEFIACVYEQDWFVGKVVKVDNDDVEVSFMEHSEGLFKWAVPVDKIWVMKENILCKILPPMQSGQSKRTFKLAESDRSTILSKFLEFKS